MHVPTHVVALGATFSHLALGTTTMYRFLTDQTSSFADGLLSVITEQSCPLSVALVRCDSTVYAESYDLLTKRLTVDVSAIS